MNLSWLYFCITNVSHFTHSPLYPIISFFLALFNTLTHTYTPLPSKHTRLLCLCCLKLLYSKIIFEYQNSNKSNKWADPLLFERITRWSKQSSSHSLLLLHFWHCTLSCLQCLVYYHLFACSDLFLIGYDYGFNFWSWSFTKKEMIILCWKPSISAVRNFLNFLLKLFACRPTRADYHAHLINILITLSFFRI